MRLSLKIVVFITKNTPNSSLNRGITSINRTMKQAYPYAPSKNQEMSIKQITSLARPVLRTHIPSPIKLFNIYLKIYSTFRFFGRKTKENALKNYMRRLKKIERNINWNYLLYHSILKVPSILLLKKIIISTFSIW